MSTQITGDAIKITNIPFGPDNATRIIEVVGIHPYTLKTQHGAIDSFVCGMKSWAAYVHPVSKKVYKIMDDGICMTKIIEFDNEQAYWQYANALRQLERDPETGRYKS
jgi:hypothetical protein